MVHISEFQGKPTLYRHHRPVFIAMLSLGIWITLTKSPPTRFAFNKNPATQRETDAPYKAVSMKRSAERDNGDDEDNGFLQRAEKTVLDDTTKTMATSETSQRPCLIGYSHVG